MTKPEFDIRNWLEWADWRPDSRRPPSFHKEVFDSITRDRDVESLIEQLEAYHIDITYNYRDWVTIGFALADEYGMEGCSLFHRISRIYPKYDPGECDSQYTRCLNGRSGITIRTFFWLAAQAGIIPEK